MAHTANKLNIAVILAGGEGRRIGANIPKQFLKVAGKTVLEHTISIFEKHKAIDETIVVAHANFLPMVEEMVVNNKYRKVKRILGGGQERYESSLVAINATEQDGDVNLIFHDSVRPLVSDRIIDDCVLALECYGAVDVAIPSTDTILVANDEQQITSIPDRSKLRNGQTPQAFKREVIKRAYDLALQDPHFKTTDDCGVVLRYLPNEPIYIVRGEGTNIKLTHQEDLFLLDKLFQLRTQTIFANKTSNAEVQNKQTSKVVAVIGGTEGIGLEIANTAQERGSKVFVASRRLGVDVCSSESVAAFFQKIYDECGQIDYVINTSGILDKQALSSMSYEDIQRSIEVNYLGSIICAKEAFPYLEKSKGMLQLFTSSSYTRGRMLYSIYSSTKAAIVNLTQALAEEWAPFDVRINCINPERTKTPMREKNFGFEPEDTLLSAGEVAEVSCDVLDMDITGQIIDVRRKHV